MKAKNIIYSIPTNEYISEIIKTNYGIAARKIDLYKTGGGLAYLLEDGSKKLFYKVFPSYFLNDEIHKEVFNAVQSFKIMDHLYKNGFPVIKILRTDHEKLYSKVPMAEGDSIGALFEYIECEDIDFDDNEEKIAKTTASMHNIMKNYDGGLNVLGRDFYTGRMMNILHQYYGENEKVCELAELGNYAFDKVKDLPKGFSHGDYGTHNIKSHGGRLFVFDFDVASGTYPMYDVALVCDTSNFWEFDEKAMKKVKENVKRLAEIYTRHCELSQNEIDSYLHFLALRQYEVRASVAFMSIYKIGSYFLNENYLNSLHGWMVKYINYAAG